MSKKKKNKIRSFKEAQRAQLNSTERTYISDQLQNVNLKNIPSKPSTDQTMILPIEEIKHDLIKNIIFAGFSIAVIVALSITNAGFDQLSKFFSL